MARIVAMHELDLRPGADRTDFERVVRRAVADLARHMPGLIERHYLRGHKGARAGEYAMLWIFESQAALEALFGTAEVPDRGPDAFVRYEETIAPFLAAPSPELIRFTDYLAIDDATP